MTLEQNIRAGARAIQAYRIAAEKSGAHMKRSGEFTAAYTESGPLLWALRNLQRGVDIAVDWDVARGEIERKAAASA